MVVALYLKSVDWRNDRAAVATRHISLPLLLYIVSSLDSFVTEIANALTEVAAIPFPKLRAPPSWNPSKLGKFCSEEQYCSFCSHSISQPQSLSILKISLPSPCHLLSLCSRLGPRPALPLPTYYTAPFILTPNPLLNHPGSSQLFLDSMFAQPTK